MSGYTCTSPHFGRLVPWRNDTRVVRVSMHMEIERDFDTTNWAQHLADEKGNPPPPPSDSPCEKDGGFFLRAAIQSSVCHDVPTTEHRLPWALCGHSRTCNNFPDCRQHQLKFYPTVDFVISITLNDPPIYLLAADPAQGKGVLLFLIPYISGLIFRTGSSSGLGRKIQKRYRRPHPRRAAISAEGRTSQHTQQTVYHLFFFETTFSQSKSQGVFPNHVSFSLVLFPFLSDHRRSLGLASSSPPKTMLTFVSSYPM